MGPYSDSYCVLARFLGRFARSIATISIVLRVYVKLIIDPWIDHLQDHAMGRNPYTLVHILGSLHPRSGVAIRHVLRKLQSSSDFQLKGARSILCYCLIALFDSIVCHCLLALLDSTV
jgi:hypothetical protein